MKWDGSRSPTSLPHHNVLSLTYLEAVRHHSRVENKLHWTLDVAFEEDLSRVRTGHAAQNLGIVRRLALSLLKQETSRSVGVKLKRKDAGWNSDYLLKVLTAGN